MKNKAQAIEAIQNDCEISHRYYQNGQTCAIGGLLLAVDPTFDFQALELTETNVHAIAYQTAMGFSEGPEDTQSMRTLLMEHFGFKATELAIIQAINDRYGSPEVRRAEIIMFIETIPED